MTSKFLTTSSSDLSNGTANLYIAQLTVDNLDPALPLKTDNSKTLISSLLNISDVNNLQNELDNVISNPLTSPLDFDGFGANDLSSIEFNLQVTTTTPPAGTLKLYANNDGELHQVDEKGDDTVVGGEVYNQPLNTFNDVEFKSTKINNWTTSADGVNLKLETNTMKFVFGEHLGTDYTSICIFGATNNSAGPGVRTFRSRGTLANPIPVINNDVLDARRTYVWTGNNYIDCASFRFKADGNHSLAARGTYTDIELTPNGSNAQNTYYEFRTNKFNIGRSGIGYSLPTSRGTDTQILKTDGAGVVSWADSPFNQNLNTTDTVAFNQMTTRTNSEIGGATINNFGSSSFWQHQNDIGGSTIQHNKSRGTKSVPTAVLGNDNLYVQNCRGYNGTIYKNGASMRALATENWTGAANGANLKWFITPTGTTIEKQYLTLSGSGLNIGDASANTDYTLPTTRGADTQILKTDAAGAVSWADSPFNQNLNTTDGATFNLLNIGSTTSGGTTQFGSGGFSFFNRWFNGNGGVGISTNRYRGTQAAPLAILNDDTLYAFINNGYDGAGLIQGSSFRTFAIQNWSPGNNGTCFEIDITPLNQTGRRPYFRLDSGGMTVGDIDGGQQYTIPPVRGTDGQILKTDAAGVVSWVNQSDINPFDQELNKSSNVLFASVKTPSIDNDGGLTIGGNSPNMTMGKSATLCDFLGNVEVNQTATMSGQLTVGVSPIVSYDMPTSRGNYGQVLRQDTGGQTYWGNNGNYSQTGAFQVVQNTAAKTSIVGAGVGSLDVPVFGAGCSYHIKLSGAIEDVGPNEELKIIVDIGGTTVYESQFYDLDDIKTEQIWETEIDIVCRTSGAAGTFYANGQFIYSQDSTPTSFRGFNTEYDSVINTTIPNTFDISAQWSNANAANIFTCKMLTLTKTF